MEVSSPSHMQSLAGSSFPLPTPKDRRWGWKFQALNHDLVSLVTCFLPEAIEEAQESPYLNKRLCYHPGNSKRLRSLDSDSAPITEEITKILDLCQQSESKSNCWNKRLLWTHVYKQFSVSGTGDRELYTCVCVHIYNSYYFATLSKDCELIIICLYSQSRNLFLV